MIETTVYPKDESLRYTQLNEYLSLVKLSDTAFQELINYFNGVEEDVVIVMFGDH